MDFNGKDITQTLNITFDESLSGVEKEIQIEKEVLCTSCNGTKEA